MSTKSYKRAIGEAYEEALLHRDDTFIMGEDVELGIHGTTTGLADEFGDRVRDTPISEQAFHGVAVGAAIDGKRPIVEHQINTMSFVAMDQIVNNAHKLRHMTGGDVSVPMTITVPGAGAHSSYGGQHSDNIYPMLVHAGVKVLIPSTPYDAKGLFHAAVREDDPVMVFYPQALMDLSGEVPDEPYTVPIGETAVTREGSDVSVVAIGGTLPLATSVAAELSSDVDLEVVNPKSLLPLDEEPIFESVRKTGRTVIVDDANRNCGGAAEVAARISNHCFESLEAPIKRVTRLSAPVSYSPPEEQFVLPNEEDLKQAISDISS